MNSFLEVICFTFLILCCKCFWGIRIRKAIRKNEYPKRKDRDRYYSEFVFKFNYLYFKHKKYVSKFDFYGNLVTFAWAIIYFVSGIIYVYIYKSFFCEVIYYLNLTVFCGGVIFVFFYVILTKPDKNSIFFSYKEQKMNQIIIYVLLFVYAVLCITSLIKR